MGTPDAFAQTASLENTALRVRIESGSIAELRDVRTGHDFARPGPPLWELQLNSGGKALVLNASEGRGFEEPLPGVVPGRHFVWRDFTATGLSNLTVEVWLALDSEPPAARWRIAVEGLTSSSSLVQIRFPIIQGPELQAGEQLAVPVWMGQLASEPRKMLNPDGKARRSQWHYPGELSLQCMAYSGQKAGLYLACDDTAAFRKAFAVASDGTGEIGFDTVHWPEMGQAAGSRWTLPYAVITGVFEGDWFSAAERYRSWATNQAWAVESRVATGLVPPWVQRTALWVWNRGRSQGVLDPAVALQRRLGLPVSVFWHWWHGCAYDMGFPEYLPPREGTEHFAAAVARARRRDVNALIYMNQRLWGTNTASWSREGAAAWAVKGPDRQIHPEIYNTFTRAPCASMCLGTEFWRHKYAAIAQEAVTGLGVSGIYMDQACLSLSCFDPTHGHPIGGGAYWVNGFRLLASDIRQRCAPQTDSRRSSFAAGLPALAGEGCGEPWLPHLDAMLSLQVSRERYAAPDGWETIPFFHAVYHPYAILFGNYSSLTMPPYDDLWPPEFAPAEPLQLLDRKFSSQFLLEQARAFVWGQQPTLANFRPEHLHRRAEEMDYVLRLAKLRQRATKYLLQGTLLRPPRIEVAEAALPFSRLSIYAGQQSGLKAFEKSVPRVVGAAWRAPDRQVAIALASIADEPVPIRLTVSTEDYGLAAGGTMTRCDARGQKKMGTVTAPVTTLKLDIPAREAWIIQLGEPFNDAHRKPGRL